MAKNREKKLQDEMSILEDAILYAESKGKSDLGEAKLLLSRVKKFFEQGTWSLAEKELINAVEIKESHWFREFIEKRAGGKDRASGTVSEQIRFEGDGLCGKYGHLMIQIRLSNVRWYYQCRICGKKGKYRSIK